MIEGLPGLGKTKLISTISRCLNLGFRRIQFTPDLMPSDITGTDVLVKGEGESNVIFQEGPVFTNILLADEINRATPRTQSALLEVMQERTVTVMGETRKLPSPFFVLATQNPIDLEGTYPLPEAQLDRFLFKIHIEAEGEDELTEILSRFASHSEPEVEPLLDRDTVLRMQQLVRDVILPEPVARYVSSIVLAGLPSSGTASEAVKKYVKFGPSARAALALALAGKTIALSKGRPNVDYSDIDDVSFPALRHRILFNFEGEATGINVNDIIAGMLDVAHRRK